MAAYTGKVIVLTGASQGIGRALALRLAEERPRLVLAARDESALATVEGECRERGASTLVVPTDVTSDAQCRALVERTVARFSALDVLVNNAGIGMIARFDELADLSVYERLMKVNYLGCVYPTFYALPHLKRSRGQIAVMASLAGLTGVPTRTGYAASKHAVIGFFDSLRIELAGTGVDVTVLCPYFVRSQIHRARGGERRWAPGHQPHEGRPHHDRRGLCAAQRRGHGAPPKDAGFHGQGEARPLGRSWSLPRSWTGSLSERWNAGAELQ